LGKRMSEVNLDELERDSKTQYEIGKFISRKWPKPVTYDEIREAFKFESDERLKDFLEALLQTRWVVREGGGFVPHNTTLAFEHQIVKCRECGSTYPVKYAIHAGFSDMGFLYCDQDTTVLTFSSYDSEFEQLQSRQPPGHLWTLIEEGLEEDIRRIESRLMRCPCGGKFSSENPLLCPNCRGVLSEPISKTIYLIVLDRWIDGEKQSVWQKT